ncbi:MAG: selenocysteine-specific translation elongation factor [Anaerolineales bacterium]|nr:selenocysteine-specific translation elongation factor [Anaerolineales bacterium]MDW8276797.1 selenocysteine-specific translation elongation factor [Anaerolineales bacterium]
MRVIGTAGHVDHGKSTLIAALTGVHPDRLKEEQAREMTIELGFGWLTLPGGEEVGMIDVPGHRDFIGNMLAGVGGIDAALLVIAADEGVMPQTREHLAILDLLQISKGVIVLSKTDMVDDDGWLALVEEDIRRTLTGTCLEGAPMVRVSARTRTGLDNLLRVLEQVLGETAPRPDWGRPRLPIDRVFTMPGFGTVVTGTLSDGRLSLGDEVEILPSGKRGRIRGLQTHKKKENVAIPGSRTAVNISGIAVEEIARGDVLVIPGHYQPTRRLDARFRLLKDVSAALTHGTEVKVFLGAAEVIATLRLLGVEALHPGEEGWIQLELRDPLVATRGDRYILRRPSPSETLGGGQVVDAHPKQRHKRFDANVLQGLEMLAQGTPAEVLLAAANRLGAATAREIAAKAQLTSEAAASALRECLENGFLIALEDGEISPSADVLLISHPLWMALKDSVLATLSNYHKAYPLRRGIPREELKSRLKLPPRLFQAALKRLNLAEGGNWSALPDHEIRFSAEQEAKVRALLKKFAAQPYAPPSVKECQAEAGEDVYAALVELGELIPVSAEVVFRKSDYDQMVNAVRGLLMQQGQATAAEVRDLFQTSRKYALALLEHLDSMGITRREGDVRRLR